jgi:hypothetical protein
MRALVVLIVIGLAQVAPSLAQADPVEHPDDPDAVSEIQMIVGPPTAALVGFGLGHVVEGRWHEKGWIFTAGETASMSLLIVSSIGTECDHNCSLYGAAFYSGLITMMGFRIWETIDSVNGARAKNRRIRQAHAERDTRLGFGIAPHRDGAIAGLTLRF